MALGEPSDDSPALGLGGQSSEMRVPCGTGRGREELPDVSGKASSGSKSVYNGQSELASVQISWASKGVSLKQICQPLSFGENAA